MTDLLVRFVSVAAIVALQLALLFWVVRDSRRLGLNPILWLVVVFFLNILGLVLYLVARSAPPKLRRNP